MSKHYYFDNHSSTWPCDEAILAMQPYLQDHYASPLSPHNLNQKLCDAQEQAYRKLYKLLGADPEDTIFFTSSGAEAINQAIMGCFYKRSKETGHNHFITGQTEQAPIILCLEKISELGAHQQFIAPNSQGFIDPEKIIEAITPRTAMISLSLANALTGCLQPIDEIAQVCQERNIYLHLDISTALGKETIPLEKWKPAFLSMDGQILHAPKGTGALYVRKDILIPPLIACGHPTLYSNTVNPAGLIALGEAAEQLELAKMHLTTETARLRFDFETQLKEKLPGIHILFENSRRLPNCSAISFPKICSESLLYFLNKRKVYPSFGGGFNQQLPFQLKAYQLPADLAYSTLSFSFSRYHEQDDIDEAVAIIAEQVKELEPLSAQI